MITLNNLDELTEEVIKKIIDLFRANDLVRYEKLERYYNAKNDILNRLMADPTKPNNKIANPFASYITDTLTGYFMGEPVSYGIDDEKLRETISDIMEYNDEADENMELARDASIFGCAYELLYVDEDKMLRFQELSPKEVIPIYDNSVEQKLLAVIRYVPQLDITKNRTTYLVEVITDKETLSYTMNEGGSLSGLIDAVPHYFGMVPVAIFQNNKERSGDFEKVISLIDAYDKVESDTLNDFEYFVDAYLALYGFTADSEDVAKMKENRVLLMDEGTSAEWLTKDVSDGHIENMKNRLKTDIHKFSKCPDMSDQEFASNASGIAIKFKLLGTENVVAIKERKFKRGLQQRLEIISHFNSLLGSSFDYRDISIYFTRNIPSNDSDIVTVVNGLKDVVSTQTLLAQIPFIEDVDAELERIQKEKEEEKETNPFYTALASSSGYQTEAMNKAEAEEEE